MMIVSPLVSVMASMFCRDWDSRNCVTEEYSGEDWIGSCDGCGAVMVDCGLILHDR